MKTDIYQTVTDRIISSLEHGVSPWHKPWNAEHAAGRITRPLRHNGQPYSGINVLMLWGEAMEKGYSAPLWITFKQALELGGNVCKGERGSMVVYASTYQKTETTDAGQEQERDIPFLKSYTVFNAEQTEGLPAHFYATAAPQIDPVQKISHAEAFFDATHATVRHGGNQAFYSPSYDVIQLPPFEAFKDAESYYATRGHETIHWTRHESRLNRDFGRKRWGDEGYAAEELVAEIGSAFLAADLGLYLEPREDHASYVASWLKVLKNDKRAIFTASSHASRAVEFLHKLQPMEAAA